ncbi:hypothetical protein vseg_019832 [Gypsophila vaccaria]
MTNDSIIPNTDEPSKPLSIVHFNTCIQLKDSQTYRQWRFQIQSILNGFGLFNFLDGSNEPPPTTVTSTPKPPPPPPPPPRHERHKPAQSRLQNLVPARSTYSWGSCRHPIPECGIVNSSCSYVSRSLDHSF